MLTERFREALDSQVVVDKTVIEFDGTTVLCRVCGDKASGFHYGVHSCEGCKGFFRRSIQQKIQYRPCTKNQQCSIQRVNRNRCQYCRLKKCIAVGMSRDAVRFGRVPKREKARIIAAMQHMNAKSVEKSIMTEFEDEDKVTLLVINAYMDTCSYTQEKVAQLKEAAKAMPIYSHCPQYVTCPLNPISPDNLPHHTTDQVRDNFSERFSNSIRGVVEFSRRIPGFNQLPIEDQIILLKASAFEVLLIRLAALFNSQNNTLLCMNGRLMRRDAIQGSSNSRFLMDSMFEFSDRLNRLGLSDAEHALFSAVVVVAPDRPGLRNQNLVENMQKRLIACMRNLLAKNHLDVPDLYQTLLSHIPDLRTLNSLHSDKVLDQRQTDSAAVIGNQWDDSRSFWEDKDGGLGSPSSSCTADDAMRSPVSCSGESGSSEGSVCGSEISMYSDLRPPCPVNRRGRELCDGASSGDEGNDMTLKCPFVKRKAESPDDSGIESGTERSDKLSSPSLCSSPRSSIDEKSEEDREEEMPVLRRALQAPPIINTDLLMEEAYKPHKKFRAFPREEEPHSSQPLSPSPSTSSSILAQTLSHPASHSSYSSSSSLLSNALSAPSLSRTLLETPKMSEEALRKADMLHAMIVKGEGLSSKSPRSHSSSPRLSPVPVYIPHSSVERLQPASTWSNSYSRAGSLSPMQPCVSAQPRSLHLLTTPSPSRYYEPRVSVTTPVGLGANPNSSPHRSSPHPQGLGAQPARSSLSPMVELQVDIADSQPLNLSKKTPPPTPEFVMEV